MINTSFDFTSDTPGYWNNFWENNNGLGAGSADPDSKSPTLKEYHRQLWSRPLPNGDIMDLTSGTGSDYLNWKGFRFSSDSILVSFRYKRYMQMLETVAEEVPDYKAFVEKYLRQFYTIGGMIIFPKRAGGINQSRGCNNKICDRWDLTLECIRRFYNNQESPLQNVLEKDKQFFNLFVSFKGYVDFFFLQDAVSSDYSSVVFWEGDGSFKTNPLPATVDSYLLWIEREIDFVKKRNKRIEAFYDSSNNKE